jgi:2',3'-cyclic-nucleotide 2'-phosphodiesterase (5'-nucleotidase family)
MLKTYSKITLLFSVVLYATACKTYYPISYQSSLEKVTQSVQSDTSIKAYYLPFKDSLDKIMKIPIAELKEDIVKKMPESTLGNLMADILKIKTQAYLNTPIDFSVLNYGGIRMGSLTKGTLNIEHAYLLMPFDNYLVAQNLTGQQVQFFL